MDDEFGANKYMENGSCIRVLILDSDAQRWVKREREREGERFIYISHRNDKGAEHSLTNKWLLTVGALKRMINSNADITLAIGTRSNRTTV